MSSSSPLRHDEIEDENPRKKSATHASKAKYLNDVRLESLPMELIQENVLPYLQCDDISELRVACKLLHGKIDAYRHRSASWKWKKECMGSFGVGNIHTRYSAEDLDFSLKIMPKNFRTITNTLIQAAAEGYAQLCSNLFDMATESLARDGKSLNGEFMKYLMQCAVAEAVQRNRSEVVKVLVTKHPAVLADDSSREALLKIACEAGNADMIRHVLPETFKNSPISSIEKILKALFHANSSTVWDAFVECTTPNARNNLNNAGNIIFHLLIQTAAYNIIGRVLSSLHINATTLDAILVHHASALYISLENKYEDIKSGFEDFIRLFNINLQTITTQTLHRDMFIFFVTQQDSRFVSTFLNLAGLGIICNADSARQLGCLASKECCEGLVNTFDLGELYASEAIRTQDEELGCAFDLSQLLTTANAPETKSTDNPVIFFGDNLGTVAESADEEVDEEEEDDDDDEEEEEEEEDVEEQ